MGLNVLDNVTAGFMKKGKKAILVAPSIEVCFGGNPVPFYKNSNTFLLPLELGTDAWDKGSLTCDGGTLYFEDDGSIAAGVSKSEAISGNKSFKLLYMKGTEYYEYDIVFTGLPIMTINTKETPAMSDNPIDEDDVECGVSFYEVKNGSAVYQTSDALIHERGGSTSEYPKKGYKVNLVKTAKDGTVKNNSITFAGLRKDDDWVLLPMYTEDTKIREKFSIDVWRDFGLDDNDYDMSNGTRMEYIELIINGEYWGMFGLLEPIDAKQLNLTDGDIMFKVHSWTKPTAAELRKAGNIEMFVDETVAPAEREAMEIKYPSKVTQDAWNVAAIFMENVYEFSSSKMVENIGSWVDVDNTIDHWIFINFICAEDNTWKNIYMTFKKTDSGYKLYVTPWDFDLTFGEKWDGSAYLHWKYEKNVVTDIYAFEYTKRVINMNIDGAKAKLYARWMELRSDVLDSNNLIQRIDDIETFILSTGAYARDKIKWPSSGHTTNLKYFKDIVLARLNYLDTYIEQHYASSAG